MAPAPVPIHSTLRVAMLDERLPRLRDRVRCGLLGVGRLFGRGLVGHSLFLTAPFFGGSAVKQVREQQHDHTDSYQENDRRHHIREKSAADTQRNGEQQGKTGHMKVDQSVGPEGRGGAGETEDLREETDLDRLDRAQRDAQRRKGYGKERYEKHASADADCADGDADRQRNGKDPPELKQYSIGFPGQCLAYPRGSLLRTKRNSFIAQEGTIRREISVGRSRVACTGRRSITRSAIPARSSEILASRVLFTSELRLITRRRHESTLIWEADPFPGKKQHHRPWQSYFPPAVCPYGSLRVGRFRPL